MKRGKIRKIIIAAVTVGVVLSSFVGCGQKQEKEGTSTKETSNKKLNIAIQPVIGFLPLYIMKDDKTLEKALSDAGYQVDVTYTEYESGPPENEAFAAGLADVGVIGNVPALSAIASGQDRKLIGIAYNGEKTQAIIVPKDSEIKKVSDLKGKKIGLVVGSIAQNFVSAVFEKEQLEFQDVQFVNLSAGEQQQALETKQVDAVATWEPTISKLTSDGKNTILADGTGVFLGENPIIARGKYVESNPEIVQIFLDEYKKTVEKLKADQDTYAEKYSKYFGLDKSIVQAALTKVNPKITIDEEDVTDLQKTAEFLKKQNLISTDIKVNDYVDDSFGKKLK